VRGLTVLICALAGLALAACGESSHAALPEQRVRTIAPPHPQRLAFLTGTRIGVLGQDGVEWVGRLEEGMTITDLEWSGDGRQLAWEVTDAEDYEGRWIEMVDVEDGSRQRWPTVGAPPDPGLEGVTAINYLGRFVEYLPNGERRGFAALLPPPMDPAEGLTGTSLNTVMPLGDRWLVLAEHYFRAGRGGPVRAFLFDPQVNRFEEVEKGTGIPAEPIRLKDGSAAWIERRSGSACLSADEVGAYGVEIPDLPARDDERTWGIGNLTAGEGISVIAYGTGQFGWNGAGCDSEDTFTRFDLENGRWVEGEQGLLDLDLAADGRVARVWGRICEEEEACQKTRYSGIDVARATVEDPASGDEVVLPPETSLVRFSPAVAAAAPEYGGSGSALEAEMTLDAGGIGPWRLGMTPVELQEDTSTPLTFELDGKGCGTVAPSDPYVAEDLGLEGQMRGGELAGLRVTTLDREGELDEDEDYEPDSLSDLQPGVGSIEPRGPRIEGRLRAGDTVDWMLEGFGTPADQTEPNQIDAVDYSYDLGEGVSLLAHADGAGVLRRIELRRRSAPSC
jgi:hypothetical protein